MTRFSFYKKYYEITNKIYAEKSIWFVKDRNSPRYKGQINISKTERTAHIIAQYFVLIATGILSIVEHNRYIIIGCMYFLLTTLITDFSILKIEILYLIFSLKNPYSALLQKAFLGNMNEFWALVKPNTKKIVSGFVRTNSGKFVAKYDIVFRKKRDIATIVITPFCLKIKTPQNRIQLKEPKATVVQIATDISEILQKI